MSKIKRERPSEFESFGESDQVAAGGSSLNRDEGPTRKRQRPAPSLNFSIESIMKLAPTLVNQSPANDHHQHHTRDLSYYNHNLNNHHQTNNNNSKSKSPPTGMHSPAFTASVSGDESPKSLVDGGGGSSRASTPISPGNAADIKLEQTDNDDDDDYEDEDDRNHHNQRHRQRPVSPQINNHLQSASLHNSNHNHHSSSSSRRHHQKGASQTAGSSSSSSFSANSGESRLNQVECQLDNKEMWDKFHALNTEMIITKTGRRMFPVMKVQFHNLDPTARYAVSMDIVPVDNKRYRYAYHKSCWQVAGKADPSAEPRLYPHPDSPFNGDLLSRQVISFEKVKLTNNEMDKSGHIILNSMHKYQPRVHLIELKVAPPTTGPAMPGKSSVSGAPGSHSSFSSTTTDHLHHSQHNNNNNNNHHHHSHHNQQQQQPQLDIKGYRTFVFPETVFTAVTAYQNQLITKMKIDKNPFAKGFRDSSRLSDLDRNDPFDYMGSLGPSGRFGPPGAPGSMEAMAAAAAAANGAQMDAYQLLASAANNPWYSAAAVAAAAGGAAGNNPFNPMGACSTAQAAQLQATQAMWLAAFSGLLNGGSAGAPPGAAGPTGAPGMSPLGPMGPSGNLLSAPHLHHPSQSQDQNLPVGELGHDSSGGRSSSSSANV